MRNVAVCCTGDPRTLHQLPDTMAFLQLLHRLQLPATGSPIRGAPQGTQAATAAAAAVGEELPEVRAARVLFRWVPRYRD
jgi:hypothetical protein